MESREERLAKNEALFREVNNRIVDVGSGALGLEVVCECGDGACQEMIHVTVDEYAQVRNEPTLFLVVPGHDAPEVEEIVSGTDRFDVVRKHPGEGRIARATH
jgi:hypothetical protein